MRCTMGRMIRQRGCKVFEFKNFIAELGFKFFSLREICLALYLLLHESVALRRPRFERCFFEVTNAATRCIKYPARMHASAALVRNLVGRATRARPSEGNERVTSVITSSSVRSIVIDLSGKFCEGCGRNPR